jgi:enoyl-CoA hydratase/carnithine racemase
MAPDTPDQGIPLLRHRLLAASTPVDPGEADGASVDPALVAPASVDPASVAPTLVDPTPLDPALVELASVDPALVDVALVDAALVDRARWPHGVPAPWVVVPDVAAAVDQLQVAVERCPTAACVAAHVLRRAPGASVDEDLLVESLAYATLQAGPEHQRWLASTTRPAHRPATAPPVVLRRHDDRLTVTLARPEVRNAYDTATRDGLCEALALVRDDPTIGDVRLRGAGSDFCAGGDLGEFGAGPDPVGCHLVRRQRSAGRLLAQVADRVTAEVHGACVGAGVELAAFAGRVLATADARFRLPELSMGLLPGAGGTASLPRRIGRHRTAWMVLSGAWVDAAQARSWGLVDQVVDQVVDEVVEERVGEPGEQVTDGPAEQALDRPADQALDGPADQALDGPADQALDGPADQALDGPGGDTFGGPPAQLDRSPLPGGPADDTGR